MGITISPSTTTVLGKTSLNTGRSSGKYRWSGRSPRLPRWISAPSRNTSARKPSHFGSYRQPGPAGISSRDRANIGVSGGLTTKAIRHQAYRRYAGHMMGEQEAVVTAVKPFDL